MQSNPSSPPSTSSTSTVEIVEGTHVFHLCGYRYLRGIGAGGFVRSGTFPAGGYLWSLRFYPGGDGGADGRGGRGGGSSSSTLDCCFHADFMAKGAATKACFTIGLVNQADGSTRWEPTTPLIALSTAAAGHGSPSARIAVRRSKVEDFAVLRGDRVTIVCVVGVVSKPRVSAAAAEPVSRVKVPPPDLPECLGRLLDDGVGGDVTVRVGDETFAAHKILLATRSPVFHAQLYGPMREKAEQHLTIEDMQPATFRTLLRFVYTDSLPAISSQDEDDRREAICHLLAAADRYGMERLKTVCQGILCKALTVHTVAAMLALADQHHCDVLKDDCMEFIFSPNRLGDVVESQGYAKLRTTCPSVLVEILERSSSSARPSSEPSSRGIDEKKDG